MDSGLALRAPRNDEGGRRRVDIVNAPRGPDGCAFVTNCRRRTRVRLAKMSAPPRAARHKAALLTPRIALTMGRQAAGTKAGLQAYCTPGTESRGG